MTSSAASTPSPTFLDRRPVVPVTVVAWLVTLWCLGFAVVNIYLELTDHLDESEYAAYASAFTVMNWLVVVLKLAAGAVALLSVGTRPRFVPPGPLGVMLWTGFATLGVYALGSLAQAVGMLTGLAASADQVDPAGVAYVLFFLLAAAGFGVLAISYSRRHGLGWRHAVVGALGGPVVLGVLLLAMPMLLAALGLMPAP